MSRRVTAQYAAQIAGVDRSTLHRWVRTGRLTRHSDGYDLAEVLAAEASRDHDALCTRAGIPKNQRPPRRVA